MVPLYPQNAALVPIQTPMALVAWIAQLVAIAGLINRSSATAQSWPSVSKELAREDTSARKDPKAQDPGSIRLLLPVLLRNSRNTMVLQCAGTYRQIRLKTILVIRDTISHRSILKAVSLANRDLTVMPMQWVASQIPTIFVPQATSVQVERLTIN